MATSERTPEISSETRNSIGCEKLKMAPGTRFVTVVSIASMSSSLLPNRHVSGGFNMT